jgi:hypothetical protein
VVAVVNRYIITLKKDEPHGKTREVEVTTTDIAEAERLALAVEGPGWIWWGSLLVATNV